MTKNRDKVVVEVIPEAIVDAFEQIMRPENSDRYFGSDPQTIQLIGRSPERPPRDKGWGMSDDGLAIWLVAIAAAVGFVVLLQVLW